MCGGQVLGDARFCAFCGAPVQGLSIVTPLAAQTKRERWFGYRFSRLRLVVGVLVILLGLLFVSVGLVGITMPVEVWNIQTTSLYSNKVERVPGWIGDYWVTPYLALSPILTPAETKDFVVRGTIEEVTGHNFNFYVFSPENYEYWKAKLAYRPYLEVKGKSRYTFEFMVWKQEYDALRFVVENPNADFGSPDLVFKISATLEWRQRSLSRPIAALITGILLGLIGMLLLVGGSLVLYSWRKVRKELPKSVRYSGPMPNEEQGGWRDRG